MTPRTMIFIDGENLQTRFETMLKGGRKPTEGTVHSEGRFLWHPNIPALFQGSVIRVSYYTSYYGDDDSIFSIRSDISKIQYWKKEDTARREASVVPEVFKKLRRAAKSKSVDINLTTDLLRSAYTNGFDRALIITGDGDYIPVIQDAMRLGKQIYVGALSSGLHKELPLTGDHFFDLDPVFLLNEVN